MELTDLTRYMPVESPREINFAEIRKLQPVKFNQNLEIIDDKVNLTYAKKLAQQGYQVIPIRRVTIENSFQSRNSFPRRILFEMTSNCNYLCRMCPQQNLLRPKMDMDKELYKKVLDEIDYHGIEGLWLYHLGESLLHPDFDEILKHLATKENLGAIWMSTNGELFTEDKIKTALNSNIDFINFSAHATTAATYKTVTHKSFKRVNENLNTFYRLKGCENLPRKPFLHCQMIEQETTKHEVDEFIAIHFKRADIVSINMLEYVNLPNNEYGREQRIREPLSNCLRVSRNDCFICSNGAVTLCDAAYNGEIDLGNINSSPLFDIWNGKGRKKILTLNKTGQMHKMEFCQNCTDYDI